nr:hypothetical protein Iba_chr13fCG6200 [Ipomoea batatas]
MTTKTGHKFMLLLHMIMILLHPRSLTLMIPLGLRGMLRNQGKEDKVLLPFSSLIYALNVFAVSESMSIPTRPPCVSINIGVVRTRLNSTQSVLANFKSFVAQVEKIMLDDKKLLHSLEAEEQAYAPTR